MAGEQASKTDLTLINCNVVDVVAAEILPSMCVVIDKGKIAHVVDNSSRGPFVENSRKIVDCKGSYIMPGLIDCHVHVTAYTADFSLLEKSSPAYVTARAVKILREMLDRGFTTVRDAGGADHGLARAVAEGHIVGPRLLFCGKALSQTGGHGDMRGPGDVKDPLSFECRCCAGLGRVCDGDAEVRKAARDEIRKGATHIKVMAGGGVTSPTDRISSTQFSLMELSAIVEEAAAANLYVMAHAYTPRAILNAVKAGVKSIEHGNLLDDDAAKAMSGANVALVPTLVTYEALANEGLNQGLTEEMVNKVHDVLDAGKRSIGIARRHGVEICFGTDLLAEMHRHQMRGMALLEDAGMPVEEIIRTATVNAARLIDREGELGVITEGAIADILVLKKNPLTSTKVFGDWKSSYDAIVKEGEIHFSRLPVAGSENVKKRDARRKTWTIEEEESMEVAPPGYKFPNGLLKIKKFSNMGEKEKWKMCLEFKRKNREKVEKCVAKKKARLDANALKDSDGVQTC